MWTGKFISLSILTCINFYHLIYSKIVVKNQDHFAEDIAWLPEKKWKRGLYFKGSNRWVVEAGNLNLNSGKCWRRPENNHDDCYRHRVCNSEFPCEICKSWTSEKRQSVERMIDKARFPRKEGLKQQIVVSP
jgi:hypothetical protein